MLGQLANVDATIAKRVADGLGMTPDIKAIPTSVAARTDLEPSPALSILKKAKPGLETKVIGCLVADGTSAKDVQALKTAAMKLGAALKIIAPRIGGAKAAEGTKIEADFQLAGGPSVLFDAVYIALSTGGAALLSKDSAAVSWVHDAFAHLKVIGAPSSSQALLDAAGVLARQRLGWQRLTAPLTA